MLHMTVERRLLYLNFLDIILFQHFQFGIRQLVFTAWFQDNSIEHWKIKGL